MKKILIIICFVFFSKAGFCADLNLKDYTGYVNDYAGILSNEASLKLTALSAEIENKTTSQLAILTVDTVSPLDIETYAVKVFEKWGIGQKGKDNGVLILVAVNDRAVRIEVGYGLEGAIPDALAKDIITRDIIPFFKKSDYSSGVLQAAAVIGKLIAKEYNVEISGLDDIHVAQPSDKLSIFDFLFLIFLIIILIRMRFFWFFPMPGSTWGKGKYWYGGGSSSGGFSGGFGGFGGGFSGGGGASGRW